MTVSAEQAAAAISDLPQLRPAPRPRALSGTAGDVLPIAPPPPSAAAVGNSLLSFTAELDPTHATNLQYAVGYAQLHAVQTANIDPFSDPTGYFKYVAALLAKIGLASQGFQFSDFTTQTQTVELDQVVVGILGGLLTGDALTTAVAAIKALEADANDSGEPWAIWSSHSQSSKQGTFSVGTANETNGQVALQLSAFQLAGVETNEKFLWASYASTSLSIQYAQATLAFNDSLWASPGVGSAVIQQMQACSAGYIAGLPPLTPT